MATTTQTARLGHFVGLPREDRPREKLFERGPAALGINELLAVVLGTGTRHHSALDLANDLLGRAGGLEGLARSSAPALARLPGLREARAARLAAAIELGRRAASPAAISRPRFRLPEDAARFLLPRFANKPLEEFGVLSLDTRNRLMRFEVVSTGSLTGALVHPREVFREAAIVRAAAIIVFHNHPSGDPTPSLEDRDLTRRLQRAGSVLGIDLLDHIILGSETYWSFKEHGEL
jgi:DNA repair protein RadC